MARKKTTQPFGTLDENLVKENKAVAEGDEPDV